MNTPVPVLGPCGRIPYRIGSSAQLGRLLRAARKQLNLTQAELAGRLGVSQGRVSQLERAPGELSVDQLIAWLTVLGVCLRIRGGARASDVPLRKMPVERRLDCGCARLQS